MRLLQQYLFGFSIFSFLSVQAQFVPNTTTFHTPMGNVPVTSYYHMSYIYFNGKAKDGLLNYKDDYVVKLKNDSTIRVYGKIDLSGSIHSLVCKEDKKKGTRRIYPNETQYIIDVGHYKSKESGKPMDSCWIFQKSTGYISFFGVLSTGGSYQSIYFRKAGDDKYYPITEETMLELAGDDTEIINLIKKEKDYVKAVAAINKKHAEN